MPFAYGTAAWTRACAFTIRLAAISSMARVIFFVDCTDRMRRRRMRSWPPAMRLLGLAAFRRTFGTDGVRVARETSAAAASHVAVGTNSSVNVLDRGRERVAVGQRTRCRGSSSSMSAVTRAHVLEQLGLEALHVGDRDVVEVPARAREDRDDLLLDRPSARADGCFSSSTRRAPRSSCAFDTASSSEPNVANASSSRNCARSSFSVPETDFIALICAAPPTRDTEMPTSTAGRTPDLKRSSCEVDLAVGDRDHVRRDVRGDVAGLRLDDREAR